MQRNVSDAAIITIPVSADSKKASASSVRNGAIYLRSVQLGKKTDKPAYFVNRGDGNTSDSEDSICSILCTNETDSSTKKFTVKITVGRENVDFLVDTGSVRTFIGKSMLRNQL